jgi:hypothetical protein
MRETLGERVQRVLSGAVDGATADAGRLLTWGSYLSAADDQPRAVSYQDELAALLPTSCSAADSLQHGAIYHPSSKEPARDDEVPCSHPAAPQRRTADDDPPQPRSSSPVRKRPRSESCAEDDAADLSEENGGSEDSSGDSESSASSGASDMARFRSDMRNRNRVLRIQMSSGAGSGNGVERSVAQRDVRENAGRIPAAVSAVGTPSPAGPRTSECTHEPSAIGIDRMVPAVVGLDKRNPESPEL